MPINQKTINSIIEEVLKSVSNNELINTSKLDSTKKLKFKISNINKNICNGIFNDIDQAVNASRKAQEYLVKKCSISTRYKIIKIIRKCSMKLAEQISNMTVNETGMGKVHDKIKKNYLAAKKTPGCEILQPLCQTGDNGLMLIERAAFGIVASITPCTNPTETIICNSIGIISAGNSVIFNVHPLTKIVSRFFIKELNNSIINTGGPANLISMIDEPSIESANKLMSHKQTKLIVVTGGSNVVKAAMSSGKRAICGGPGNPPVVVDETANIIQAAKGIVNGASLDNNIVCVDEKEIFCVAKIADSLKREMSKYGAINITAYETKKLQKLVMNNKNINTKWVGKNANIIAKAIGKNIEKESKILLCEVDSEEHPFVQTELLMPILPLVRVPDVNIAITMAKKCEHNYKHTAGIYSTNINTLHTMALTMDCSIFIKNAPHYAGLGLEGEGYTSFTIASPTGEGLTSAISFTRERRCTLKDYFRIV